MIEQQLAQVGSADRNLAPKRILKPGTPRNLRRPRVVSACALFACALFACSGASARPPPSVWLGEECARAVESFQRSLPGESFLFFHRTAVLPLPPPCDDGELADACEARARADAQRDHPNREIYSCTRAPGTSCDVVRYGGRVAPLHYAVEADGLSAFMIARAKEGPFELLLANPGEVSDGYDDDPATARRPRAKAAPVKDWPHVIAGVFWKPPRDHDAALKEMKGHRGDWPELRLGSPTRAPAGWVMIRAECARRGPGVPRGAEGG